MEQNSINGKVNNDLIEIRKLICKYDDMEQGTRNHNLRTFNFGEKPMENTKLEVINLISSKTSLNLKQDDIDFLLKDRCQRQKCQLIPGNSPEMYIPQNKSKIR
ncbi:hypothetical protein JTB14_031013 [Gonioctena quinquepunctata]|nr:hypothetical protein JTB14_031013 [Gonioctena quinquepunctata]